MIELTCENTTGVFVSDIEMGAHLSYIIGAINHDINDKLFLGIKF